MKQADAEIAAKLVESHISEWCGTPTEPSDICSTFCEQYGCATLRGIAKDLRALGDGN